jgi:hypothetical protein
LKQPIDRALCCSLFPSRVIREKIYSGWLEGVGCVHRDQDTLQWWTLVNTVMNIFVPNKAGNFIDTCEAVNYSRRPLFDSFISP